MKRYGYRPEPQSHPELHCPECQDKIVAAYPLGFKPNVGYTAWAWCKVGHKWTIMWATWANRNREQYPAGSVA